MEKKKIIIVECTSSSANYIHDIIEEGYEPVLLELPVPEEEQMLYRIQHDFFIDAMYLSQYQDAKPPKILKACESYEETLKMIRELDPVLIVPGGDEGIVLATRLSHDLGLVTNDPENLPKMCSKAEAQKALGRNGVRCIRGITATTWEEAKEFYQSLGGGKIVVKPIIGGASVGVYICHNEETFKEAFLRDLEAANAQNRDSAGVLLQEYIGEDEYIVNTVSCKGVHKVTAVMVYEKRLMPGKAPIYYMANTISPDSEMAGEVIAYVLQVLDAIGVTFGAVHSEIKVDEKGPVLIEANCRLGGGLTRASWQDKVFGECESRISLRAYLHPEQFLGNPGNILMDAKMPGMVRYLSMDEDMFVKKNKVETAFLDIDGVDYAIGMGDNHLYPKTIDLATASGLIYLAHKDKEVLLKALERISQMEKEESHLLYE